MKPWQKFEVIPSLPREHDPANLDAFHEDRVRRDLARFARTPGLFAQYIELARRRFEKAGERALLEYWIKFYQTGERLFESRTAIERKKTEFLQLEHERDVKLMEKQATLAKHRAELATYEADAEEQRQRMENLRNPPSPPSEPKLTAAQQRILKKAELEQELQRLNAEEADAVAKAQGDGQKRRVQNMYASRRDQLMQQLEKFL